MECTKPLILAFLKFVMFHFYDSDDGLVGFFLTISEELGWRRRGTIKILFCMIFFNV